MFHLARRTFLVILFAATANYAFYLPNMISRATTSSDNAVFMPKNSVNVHANAVHEDTRLQKRMTEKQLEFIKGEQTFCLLKQMEFIHLVSGHWTLGPLMMNPTWEKISPMMAHRQLFNLMMVQDGYQTVDNQQLADYAEPRKVASDQYLAEFESYSQKLRSFLDEWQVWVRWSMKNFREKRMLLSQGAFGPYLEKHLQYELPSEDVEVFKRQQLVENEQFKATIIQKHMAMCDYTQRQFTIEDNLFRSPLASDPGYELVSFFKSAMDTKLNFMRNNERFQKERHAFL